MPKKGVEEEPELRVPMEGEVIGIVTRLLGYDRVLVKCEDLEVRLCRIPGRFKKKRWIREGDYVLVAPWDFQPKRADIVHVYRRDEVKRLLEQGYIKNLRPETV